MFLLTNFKSYESALWENAIKLAKAHCKVNKKHNANLQIAASIIDVQILTKNFPKLAIRTQYIDPIDYGKHTGKVAAQFLKQIGITGTIINHSENRINKEQITKCLQFAKKIGLKTIICAENTSECVEFFSLTPDFVSLEPPECIGTDICVTSNHMESIHTTIEAIGAENLMLWAGIKTPDDIQVAKKLWVAGVLISSAITTAKNPENKLSELTQWL